jgi:predicted small secreted protein
MKRKMLSLSALALAATAVTACVVAAAGMGGPIMGPASKISRPAFHGYYDGRKVTYLNTDVSSKAEAAAMHINYSASIGRVKGLPEIYLVQGHAASGQLAIFGSEPGEKNYSPLWSETILTWKASAKPTLVTSDTQVNKIEHTGKLTERDAHVVLNCPIISAAKGG